MPPLREALDLEEAGGGSSSCTTKRLKAYKKSHLACKSSSSSSTTSSTLLAAAAAAVATTTMQQQQRHLHPVITYAQAPKVIHTSPSSFMELVQKLTGLPRSDVVDRSNKTPAAAAAHDHRRDPSSASSNNDGRDRPADVYERISLHQNCLVSDPFVRKRPPYVNYYDDEGELMIRYTKLHGPPPPPDRSFSLDSVLSAEFFHQSIDAESPLVLEDTNSMASDCNSTV